MECPHLVDLDQIFFFTDRPVTTIEQSSVLKDSIFDSVSMLDRGVLAEILSLMMPFGQFSADLPIPQYEKELRTFQV